MRVTRPAWLLQACLPAVCSASVSCLLSYLFTYFNIPVRPVVSKSTSAIFAKFSAVDDQCEIVFFWILQGTLLWQPNFDGFIAG